MSAGLVVRASLVALRPVTLGLPVILHLSELLAPALPTPDLWLSHTGLFTVHRVGMMRDDGA